MPPHRGYGRGLADCIGVDVADITCPGEPGFKCAPGRLRKGMCPRCYNRQWSRANSEARAEQWRRYYEANRERLAEYGRQRDPRKRAEAQRRYHEANRQRRAEYRRQYWEKNPEMRVENARRYKARKLAALTVPFTTEQLAARMAYWGNRCWMCGGPPETVDHVIPWRWVALTS